MSPLLPFVVFLVQAGAAPPPKVDLAKAKKIFDASCAGCHGPEGSGGKGPRLAVPKLRHAQNDDQLAQIVLYGIPGTEMPPSWYLGPDGVTLAISYIRMLGASAVPPHVEGNLAKGKALFEGKGCTGCHTLGAEGRSYGPDLSDIGARRGAASLREALVSPGADSAEGFVPVHATTRTGDKISGVRINEDNFTVQVVDSGGRLHSLRKQGLSALDERPGESAMPSFKDAFSAVELQDLVAYLSSLRGEQ